VVIHCPEGAWGEAPGEAGRWIPSWMLEQEEIIGSVGAGDAFCAGFLYGCHESLPLARVFIWPTPARGKPAGRQRH
jgi:sugar/nucleoside kinase (ribokinase family)